MFQCTKCPVCNTMPFVREGKPVKTDDSVQIVQIYQCRDDGQFKGQDVGEVRTDIFDNSKQIEVYY
jgi:hypothetical protein